MRYQRFKEQDIIDKTQDMIRLLVSRQSDSFMKQLDGSFVQIGDYDPLLIQNGPGKGFFWFMRTCPTAGPRQGITAV